MHNYNLCIITPFFFFFHHHCIFFILGATYNLSEQEKAEADARSVYVGNVSIHMAI